MGPESRSGRQERRQGRDRSEGLLGVGGQRQTNAPTERKDKTDGQTDGCLSQSYATLNHIFF